MVFTIYIMEKLNQLEIIIKFEFDKIYNKQQQIIKLDSSKYLRIEDVINDDNLEINDIIKYTNRNYYYWKLNEHNRYLETMEKMRINLIQESIH